MEIVSHGDDFCSPDTVSGTGLLALLCRLINILIQDFTAPSITDHARLTQNSVWTTEIVVMGKPFRWDVMGTVSLDFLGTVPMTTPSVVQTLFWVKQALSVILGVGNPV